MKGGYFGYRRVEPCPECGTDRILLDCDDDAYVVLVVWEEVETCDGEIVERIESTVHGDEWWQRRSMEGRACPKCGGPMRIRRE